MWTLITSNTSLGDSSAGLREQEPVRCDRKPRNKFIVFHEYVERVLTLLGPVRHFLFAFGHSQSVKQHLDAVIDVAALDYKMPRIVAPQELYIKSACDGVAFANQRNETVTLAVELVHRMILPTMSQLLFLESRVDATIPSIVRETLCGLHA